MPDIPARLVVLQRLTALIEGTTGPDHTGVPFNLAGSVYRGRTEFGSDTDLPAVSILEAPNPDIGKFAGEGQAMAESWMLLIQGWAVDDPMNPSDPAYYLAAAVTQRLSMLVAMKGDGSGRPLDKELYMLGGLITSLQIGPSVVRPLDKNASSRAFYYQPVRVGLASTLNQPYLSA